MPTTPSPTVATAALASPVFVMLLPDDESRLDECREDTSVHNRTVDNVLGGGDGSWPSSSCAREAAPSMH
jgi:hypothetical protein